MNRVVVLFVGLMLFAGVGSGLVNAQAPAGFPPTVDAPAPGEFNGAGLLPSFSWIPGLGSLRSSSACGDSGVVPRVVPRIRAGYQELGMNFDFPAGLTILGFTIPQGVDYQVPRAGIWMGGATLDFRMGEPLLVFVDAAGAIPRRVSAFSSQDPIGALVGGFLTGSSLNVEWDGSRLEWWKMDVGAAAEIRRGLSIIGGLRRDQTSLSLKDPRDTLGIFNFVASLPFLNVNYDSDIQAKLWIPYFGIQIGMPYGRGRLIYSPFISSRVRVPLSLYAAASGIIGPFFAAADVAVDWDTRLTQPGQFLEGSVEYCGRVTDRLRVGLWGRGSWLKVRGTANMDIEANANIEVVPVFTGSAAFSTSTSETATFTRTLLAGGLSLEFGF